MDTTEAKELLKDDQPFQAIVDFADPIVKSLNLPGKAKILDIGTGEGNMAVTLGLNGYRVITGEPENDHSQYGKKDWRAKAEKLQVDRLITFTPLNGDDLPFENGEFDAIFLFGCLHHMPEEIRCVVLNECVRATTPKGFICVFEPTATAIETIRRVDPDHPDGIDPVEYTKGLNLAVEITKGAFFSAFVFQKENV